MELSVGQSQRSGTPPQDVGDEDSAADGWYQRLNRVRNEAIWERFGISTIAEKLREAAFDGTATSCGGNHTVRKIGVYVEVPRRQPLLYTMHADLKQIDAEQPPDRP